MSDSSANVSCNVEVYPFEGGPYSIQGGQIRSVTVSKSVRNGSPGTFAIELTPGGPLGVEDPNTWSKIVTPMSHVLIGMGRGLAQNIVMDGVAANIGESQEWSTDDRQSSARRGQAVIGNDFTWFFRSFNFYSLSYYGLVAGTGLVGALNYIPVSLVDQLGKGLIGGTDPSQSNPVQVGRLWYTKVMIGSNGILNKTYVPYRPSGTHVPLSSLMASTWENYPDVFIPYADNFMAVQELWMEKFIHIFPAPWYECFVTTSQAKDYARIKGSNGVQDAGTQFSMPTMPTAPPAGPKLVVRINPFPKFAATPPNSSGVVTPGSIDVSRWNALPLYDMTHSNYGFYSSSIRFSADGATNFYQLNPTSFSGVIGVNNANNIPTIFQFIAAADAASILRYGFRPFIGTTPWMFDPTGAAAQNKQLNVQNTILQLTANYVSWAHGEPLMATATVMLPLNPAILIGARFRYAPYKDGVPWDFYIEGFKHQFVFGGRSTTTLTLTRGLPASVYADATDGGVLKAIMTGNAQRLNGKYVVGLPSGSGPPLQFVVTQPQAAQLSNLLSATQVTPQARY